MRDGAGPALALFYMDREDQQVKGSLVLPRPDGSTAFIDYTSNAAEGNNYGLELELSWQPLDRLQLYAALGLLETEFDEYINADGEDLSGREQAHAPQYQYALGGRFDIAGGFYMRLDLEGKDAFYFSDRHDVKAPSQDLVHARLGYDAGNWSVALWGRNLTDEATIRQVANAVGPVEALDLLPGDIVEVETFQFTCSDVVELGEQEGIRFDFNRVRAVPNTMDAHRLILMATDEGRGSRMAHRLFRGFFEEGLDIGRAGVLTDLGLEAGLELDSIRECLSSDRYRDMVRVTESQVRQSGLTGVPSFIINGRVAVSGVHEPAVLVSVIEKALFGELPEDTEPGQLH